MAEVGSEDGEWGGDAPGVDVGVVCAFCVSMIFALA